MFDFRLAEPDPEFHLAVVGANWENCSRKTEKVHVGVANLAIVATPGNGHSLALYRQ
jgi:hypothetical protein